MLFCNKEQYFYSHSGLQFALTATRFGNVNLFRYFRLLLIGHFPRCSFLHRRVQLQFSGGGIYLYLFRLPRPNALRAGFDRASFRGAIGLPQQGGVVLQRFSQPRVVCAQRLLPDCDRALEVRLGLGRSPLFAVEQSQPIQRDGNVFTLIAQFFAANLQRPLVKRLGFGVAPSIGVTIGEVVQAGRRVQAARPQRLLLNPERALEQGFGLRASALLAIGVGQVTEDRGDIGGLGAQSIRAIGVGRSGR